VSTEPGKRPDERGSSDINSAPQPSGFKIYCSDELNCFLKFSNSHFRKDESSAPPKERPRQ
jgi:hypothetical protein